MSALFLPAQKFWIHRIYNSFCGSVFRSTCFLHLRLSGILLYSPHLKLSLCVFVSVSLPVFTLSVSIALRFFHHFACLFFSFSSFFKISRVPVKHFEQKKTNFIINQRLYFPFSFLSFHCNIFSTK